MNSHLARATLLVALSIAPGAAAQTRAVSPRDSLVLRPGDAVRITVWRNPEFVVEPLLHVEIGGEVVRPNLYTLRPETSVADAVALAGGPTDRGRRDSVRLLRDGGQMVLDLTKPQAGMASTPIRSGDQILVDRKRAVFRETLGPIITVAGATAAILNVILRRNR